MDETFGTLWDEEEDEDSEKKSKRTPQQQRIADLMYKEGKSYAEAYDIVINGKKPEEPEQPQPQPQVNLDAIKDDLETHAKSILNLKADVQLNSEIADRLVFQQAKEFRKQRQKLAQVSLGLEKKIDATRMEKEKVEKELWEQLGEVRKKLLELDQKKQEFTAEKAEHKKKIKGYTKQISKAALAEFNGES